MANNFKAELRDKESVLAYYELMDNPKYAIYRGVGTLSGNIIIDWTDIENPRGGEEQLRKWLEMTDKQESNTNPYTYQSITSSITKKFKGEDVIEYQGKTVIFQLHEMVFSSPRQNNNIINSIDSNKDFAIYERLFDLMEKQNNQMNQRFIELESKINQRTIGKIDSDTIEEDDEDEEEEEKETSKDKLFNVIGSILQREGIQNAIEMGAMAIMAKVTGMDKQTT